MGKTRNRKKDSFCLKIFIIHCCFIFGAKTTGFSQQSKPLSKDESAILLLLDTAKKEPNPDSSIKLFQKALDKSLKINFNRGAASGKMGIGLICYQTGNYEKGHEQIKLAYPYCLKAKDAGCLGQYYSNIALYYSLQGDYVESSANFYKALDEFTKVFKTPNINVAVVYLNLARVNAKLHQEEKAFSYLSQGVKIAREGNFSYELAGFLNNIGNYYVRTNKLDSAKQCFIEEVDIAKKNKYTFIQASAEINLGGLYYQTGQEEKGVSLLMDAIDISKNKFPYQAIEGAIALGEVWTRQKQYKKAEEMLLSALDRAKSLNMKEELLKGNEKLLDLYKAEGQYKKALSCQDTISILKDSLLGAEKTTAINMMEIKFKTAEKDKEIAANKLVIEEQKIRLVKKNEWVIIIVSSILLLTLVLAGLYKRSRHKQFALAQQVKSLQQENKIEVLKAIMSGEENERKRLARELHDGIGGMLSSAMMQYAALRLDDERLTRIPAYSDIMDLLNEIGEEIRKTAHNLMPEVLMKQPIQEAIRTYCNYVQKSNTFKINFHCHGIFENVPEDLKLNVYRIVQELLKNTSKHADATYALVQLQMVEHVLTITVEDNGCGFNVFETKNGMGLDNLNARVHNHEGHYSIQSEPGKGTSVYIEFDLQNFNVSKVL